MNPRLVSSLCALALVAAATQAMAGSRGEPLKPEEGPSAPPPVAAEPEPAEADCARTGFYLGLGGNYAVERFDNVGPGGDAGNSGGFQVHGGYRFHPNMAVELRYTNYNEFDTDPGHVSAWALTGNLKGYLLTGKWQPYAVVGLGYLNADASNGNPASAVAAGDGTVMRFGGGLEVCVHEHISIGPEIAYVKPFGSADNMPLFEVGAGLNIKF